MGKIAASAIDAAASTANTAINAGVNYKIAKDTNTSNREIAEATNEANRKLAEQQNEWQKQAVADERAYNDPSAQVQRLQGAGLSAAAAAQSIEGAGNTSAPVSADLANQEIGAPMVAPQLDLAGAIPSILQVIRGFEQYRKEKSEADKSEIDAKYHEGFFLTSWDAQKATLDLKRQEYQNTLKSFPYTLRALRYKAAADKYLPQLKELEVKNWKLNNDLVDMNVRRARQEFGFLKKMNKKQLQKMDEEIKEVLERQKLYKAEQSLTAAKTAEANATTENLKEQKKGISAESAAKEIELIYKKFGSPESTAEKVGVLLSQGVIPLQSVSKVMSGMQDYVIEGNKWLGADPYTRDFLWYYWDEGKSAASKLGMHTLGAMEEFRKAFRGTAGR